MWIHPNGTAERKAAIAGETPKNGRFHFGWATADITPTKPVAICGQYGTRISGEVNDPIYATALAIETRDGAAKTDQAVIAKGRLDAGGRDGAHVGYDVAA